MSAGAAGVLLPEHPRIRSVTSRPSLRLMTPDEHMEPDGCALDPALQVMRLTRRGRLMLTLTATVVMAVLVLVLAGSVDAASPEIDHATTVSAGQTLSEVAAVQMPGLPIQDAVARIQLVNGLSTSQVHAGQSLLIPAIP